jgi:hypothetical protein
MRENREFALSRKGHTAKSGGRLDVMLATDALVMALEVEGWMTRLLRPGALLPDETRRHHRPTPARNPNKEIDPGQCSAIGIRSNLLSPAARTNPNHEAGRISDCGTAPGRRDQLRAKRGKNGAVMLPLRDYWMLRLRGA